MGATTTPHLDRQRRFERALARIRWFGIAFGIFQIVSYQPFPGTVVPRAMYTFAGSGLALLALVNVIVHRKLRGDASAEQLRRIGVVAFAADMAAIWGLVWAFSFEQFGSTWVILAFASLEGALRYQLKGALLPVLFALPIEGAREIYRNTSYDFPIYFDSLTFRIGFLGIVGAFAGVMGRDLTREREQALDRAVMLEQLADREHIARAESTAFQQVILAGVAAAGMQEALQRMIEAIARDLGYHHIAVLMREEDRLNVVALHGFTPVARRASLAIGEGISGAVAISGQTEVIPDVGADPRYVQVERSTRSQITVPIKAADQIIGVLDCESPDVDSFDDTDAARLGRLADQMALVIENARLLSKERAMVEQLRELDQMRSDFIAIASHELRTPLTAIQGSIKTLRRTDIDVSAEDLQEFLAILDRQAERLARLVEDLLMVSHIDAGGVSLRMEDVQLHDAMSDVLAEIGHRAGRVSVAIPTDVPAFHTDGHRLRQVVRNLVDNALKFSSDQTTVRVTAHHDGSTLLLEVTDEGHGISPEDLERIFDRFYQVGGSLRRHGDGFGLGLYITRRLVEALGGSIEVSSAHSEGTTFRVRLPAVRADGSQLGAVTA